MKLHRTLFSGVLLGSLMVTSCDYLNVNPFEKAYWDDTMENKSAVIDYVSECYAGVHNNSIWDYYCSPEACTDEYVFDKSWNNMCFSPLYYGTFAANSWDQTNSGDFPTGIWGGSYDYLGYIHRFLSLIDTYRPKDVSDEDVEQYKAECAFLEGYYDFRLLAAYGPIPLVTTLVDPNIPNDQVPGRSHFDYCVDFIVKKLDEAAAVLPSTITDPKEYGRATSVIAKCIKARVLLYAASPLWNGSAPKELKEWQNKVETAGYGKELIPQNYDENKWKRALQACQDALQAAQSAGFRLYNLTDANTLATTDKLGLPYVPGVSDKSELTAADSTFLQTVRMFYYVPGIAWESNGNKEIIWSMVAKHGNGLMDATNSGDLQQVSMPTRVNKTSTGQWNGGWAGFTPTLTAAMSFYTKNGKLPAKDPDFTPQDEWFQRAYPANGTNTTEDLSKDEVAKNDVAKMNIGREARFYAWIAFDGAQYAQFINNGKPLWLNMKNTNTNGYRAAESRNNPNTGFISKKFLDPNFRWSDTGVRTSKAARRPLIRMAELYLNLAECYAALGQASEAIANLNQIRERADLPDLTAADLTSDMTIMDWVRSERFIELYEEGQRFYDLRRWCIAPQKMGAAADSWYGLNIRQTNPTFEQLNQKTKIDQPFKWVDRQYVMPIPTGVGGHDEYYSNPNMVQAPGY